MKSLVDDQVDEPQPDRLPDATPCQPDAAWAVEVMVQVQGLRDRVAAL